MCLGHKVYTRRMREKGGMRGGRGEGGGRDERREGGGGRDVSTVTVDDKVLCV